MIGGAQKQSKSPSKEEREKLEIERRQELVDLRSLMQTEGQRRALYRLLGECGIYESIWDPSAKIHFNAGVQAVGLWLMEELVQADSNLHDLMFKEGLKRKLEDAKS